MRQLFWKKRLFVQNNQYPNPKHAQSFVQAESYCRYVLVYSTWWWKKNYVILYGKHEWHSLSVNNQFGNLHACMMGLMHKAWYFSCNIKHFWKLLCLFFIMLMIHLIAYLKDRVHHTKLFFSNCSYDKAKQRYARNRDETLSPGLHLASAAEAGGLVSVRNSNIMNGWSHIYYS